MKNITKKSNMMQRIKLRLHQHFYKQWYQRPTWVYILSPLSYLLYAFGFLRHLLTVPHANASDIPIIGVGNLILGGGGKTPMVLWLARYLQDAGYRIAIVSRGYQRHGQEEEIIVEGHHQAKAVGDEPMMLYQQLQCPVVVSHDRWRGIQKAQALDIDIVICDDGIQDVSIPYDETIVVIKSEVGVGNGLGLPAGPMRQHPSARHAYSVVVHTGSTAEAGSGCQLSYQLQDLKPLIGKKKAVPSESVIQAVCGIAHPEPFFLSLEKKGYEVIRHAYPDHYPFEREDFANFSSDDIIVMSEKDAVKCLSFADDRFWVAPLKTVANHALLSWVEKRFPLKD